MRKIMMAAVGLVASSGVAWGQGAATQDVILNATVGPFCTVGGLATGSSRSANVPVANGRAVGGQITINGAQETITCSGAANVTVTSLATGLTHSNSKTPAEGCTKKIHYRATAQVTGGTAATIDTSTNSSAPASIASAVTNASLEITVNVIATQAPLLLVDGSYTDTLRVTIAPN